VQLILASASPRRAELLGAAGFTFETLAVDIDEQVHADEPPEVYVRRLAREKSARAVTLAPPLGVERLIVGADTAVVIGGEILGKPANEEEARSMLRRLSGQEHQVLTGVSVRRLDPVGHIPRGTRADELSCVETTTVCFAPLRDVDIDWYVQSREGFDKAGGYAIQGLGSRFVRRLEGSYSNVVGLPVAAVEQLIRQMAASRI
jgi:septum formation protein